MARKMSEATRRKIAKLEAEGYVFNGYKRRADGKMYREYVKKESVSRDLFSLRLAAKEHAQGSCDELGQWCD